MCGIFAWAGKDPKNFNKDKFDKLGFYNIDRGKDSCGYSYDGELYHGVLTEKLYNKFIVNRKMEPVEFPIVIGHTRQASVGNVVSKETAHPFGFGTNDKNNGYEFIGCHNGTLYNHKELADKYGIERSITEKKSNGYNSTYFYDVTRQKIDSEILLETIYKTKHFKILSKYNGAAALVFTNTLEPNKLYVWKGASKNYDTTHYQVEEERPLFYYIENKNSLYISSIQESLETIGGTADVDLFTFNNNTLYEIVDGDVSKAHKTFISRANCTQKEDYYKPVAATNRHHGYNKPIVFGDYDYMESNKHTTPESKIILPAIMNNNPNIESRMVPLNIYNEALVKPQNDYGGRLYFNKLRYWSNGHLATGIYTWVDNFGFFKIGESSISDANKKIESFIGKPFIKNDFVLDVSRLDIQNDTVLKYIPFKIKNSVQTNLHYFIDGVKIQTKLDYSMTYTRYKESHIQKGIRINYIELSEMACHPIIDLTADCKKYTHQAITQKSKIILNKFNFFTLGAEKTYTVENGNLVSLKINECFKERMFGTDEFKTLKTKEDLINLTSDVQVFDKNMKELLDQDGINYSLVDAYYDTKKIEEDAKNKEVVDIVEIINDEESDLTEEEITDIVIIETINENILEFYCDLDSLITEAKSLKGDSTNVELNKKLVALKGIQDYLLTLNEQ